MENNTEKEVSQEEKVFYFKKIYRNAFFFAL